MAKRNHFLRFSLVLGLIPLALFSGLPATGCYCADGHYKFFCHNALASVLSGEFSASSGNGGCPHCSNASSAGGTGDKHSCCRHHAGQRNGSGKCCQLIARTLATVSADVAPPADSGLLVALMPPALDASLVVLPTFNNHAEQIDNGPPLDRVIVLHCLLI
jgi:hypothetical protein